MSALPRVSKSKYNKLAKRDAYPDMTNIGKADNLLRQLRHGLGYDPLTELVSLARHPETKISDQILIAKELLGYTAAKIKSIPVNPDSGETININIAYPGAELPKEKIIDIEFEEVE